MAISAKFVLRIDGRHVCNPANLGVIAATTLLPGAWVSPGQWGNALAAAVWFVALGTIVTDRARRGDVAWAFLGAWLGLFAVRVAWLGQSWSVWLHQLGNGGVLLFAFFMISDPMTIPVERRARVAYALGVALLAYAWQFVLFQPNGLLWALFFAGPLVPLINRLRPASAFAWRAAAR
jgi:Na+-transporting NADH:ubiquinone oxidoreductase subunit NqrB